MKAQTITWGFIGRVLLKAALLFALCNILYALIEPWPLLNRVGLYNVVVSGRARLPFSQNPSESYNITLTELNSLLAAHELAGHLKPFDEYRLLLLGDSGVWGWLLEPDQTLSACINAERVRTPTRQSIHAYNLGYPILNISKDLLLMEAALSYEPHGVVWLVTLASLYPQDQFIHPIIRENPVAMRRLIQTYNLPLNPDELPPNPNFFERTIIGQRGQLAAWVQHQAYGLGWAATDIDHRNPLFSAPVRVNLPPHTDLLGGEPDSVGDVDNLFWEGLQAGAVMLDNAGIDWILINQPIFVSDGQNSDIRYNFYYPINAYDRYRADLASLAEAQGWNYLDLWDFSPPQAFTDSSFHLDPAATCDLAQRLTEAVLSDLFFSP